MVPGVGENVELYHNELCVRPKCVLSCLHLGIATSTYHMLMASKRMSLV